MSLWTLLQVPVMAALREGSQHAAAPDQAMHSGCLQAILMLVNGVAILNNDRFLEKCEWCTLWQQP